MKKTAAVYSIAVGVSILGMWCMNLLTGAISEGLIEISFHLTSEILMAILLLVGGIGLLMGKAYGKRVFLISNGMLIYSVLNAAGYYGQRSNLVMLCMFIAFFLVSTVFLVLDQVEK